MEQVRAEILKVDLPKTAAARILINAPAQQIFDLIADPRCHPLSRQRPLPEPMGRTGTPVQPGHPGLSL